MSEITFVVPGKAHGKERARTVLNQYGRAHTYTPDRQRNYEQIIKACYVAAAKGAAPIVKISAVKVGNRKSGVNR